MTGPALLVLLLGTLVTAVTQPGVQPGVQDPGFSSPTLRFGLSGRS